MYYTELCLTKTEEKTRYDTGEHTVTLEYRFHYRETFQILPALKKKQHKTVAVEMKYEQTLAATDMHVTLVLHYHRWFFKMHF